jgi:PAS domain S-box-containing protein
MKMNNIVNLGIVFLLSLFLFSKNPHILRTGIALGCAAVLYFAWLLSVRESNKPSPRADEEEAPPAVPENTCGLPDDVPHQETPAFPTLPPSAYPSKTVILVVDDDPLVLQVMSISFLSEDYCVLTTPDGESALDMVSRNRPDLILLDVVLPNKSGFDVCREIRKKYLPNELPVIMMTSRDEVSDVVEGFEAGANDYLTKPVSHRELMARVETQIHLQKADRSIRESERKYRDIFENTFDFWYVHDLNGNLLETNLAFKDGWGYENEKITGKNLRDFLSDKYKADFDNYLKAICFKGRNEGISCCVTRDGKRRYLDFRAVLVRDEDGRPVNIRGTARDMTDQIHFEKEKIELEKQIRQAQKMQAIGTLAGGIAHDFNNILFPIVGYTEMALDNVPPENPSYRDLEEVLKAANRAAELVGQILTFSRQTEEERKPVQIQPVIKEALKLLKASMPANIAVRHEIDMKDEYVLADPTQIHQIVMNLGTNAYHAMKKTGGIMEITFVSVDVGEQPFPIHDMEPGPYFRLTVKDTGYGIPPSIIDRIFEPYFTTKPVGEGTGMGLAMVHRIVKNYNGYISVSSRIGEGAEFHIYLPRIKPETIRFDIKNDEELPLGTEHILVVDDEQQIVNMLQGILENLGYSITVRYSSLDALEAFKAKPERYDLVLTDQAMPNMTGVELFKKMIAIRPDVRVILCTGFSDQVSEESFMALGGKAFLMKPILKSRLAHTIRDVLDALKSK